MESQPTELILQQLLNMPYTTITKVCNTNNNIKNICDNNEDYLYKRLLQRDFMQKINYKFLYKLCDFESKHSSGGILNKKNHFKIITNAIDSGIDNFNKVLAYNIIDINIKGRDNTGTEMTPLNYAFERSKMDIVNKLLDFNANIDKHTLYRAVKIGYIDTVKRILQMNVKIDIIVLIIAINNGYEDVINEILNKIDVSILNEKYYNNTPLTIALKKD